MIQVTLYTRDGEQVAAITMPPFQKMPEVVVWGSRFFMWTGLIYQEVMGWWCPPENTTKGSMA